MPDHPIADALASVERSTEAAFATVASSYPSSEDGSQPAANAAQNFATAAALVAMYEIQSSQLALIRSKSAAVRAFAQLMLAEHGKAEEELRKAAVAESGVSLPAKLDPPSVEALQRLVSATDADFDATYVETQTTAHTGASELFSGYVADGPDGPLKDFAARTMPMLVSHVAQVQSLRA